MLSLVQHSELAAYADAEEVAIAVLSYLASMPSELDGFLAASGLHTESIRAAAATPQFLAGVLDYVVSDARTLWSAAAGIGASVDQIHKARHALMPSAAVTTTLDPQDFGPGPLTMACGHCSKVVRTMDRRRHPRIPGPVRTVSIPRCGSCGGGFDQPETWLDANGNEVG